MQICRAHGIAYDDTLKSGSAFTLMSSTHRESLGMMTIAETLHDAVSLFALNMITLHNDISSPNMNGTSNFQGIATFPETLSLDFKNIERLEAQPENGVSYKNNNTNFFDGQYFSTFVRRNLVRLGRFLKFHYYLPL